MLKNVYVLKTTDIYGFFFFINIKINKLLSRFIYENVYTV